MLRSVTVTLIISNEEMNDIMKIDISLDHCGLLIKRVSEIIKKWSKITKRKIPQYVIKYITGQFKGESINR